MRILKLLFLSVTTLFSFSAAAQACTCTDSPSPCQEFRNVKAVFVGRVLGFTDTPIRHEINGEKETYDERTFRFLVEDPLKGVNTAELNIETGVVDSSCHVDFEVGESYLIYAGRNSKGKLGVGGCSRYKQLPWAHGEIDMLHALSKGTKENNIFGTLQRVAYDFKDNRSSSVVGALSGIRIQVEGSGGSFEAVTNSDGHYKIAGVPDGDYKITAFLSKPFETRSREIEVKKNGCGVEANFEAELEGQIKGKVLDALGHPVGRATVMLMPVAKASEDDSSKSIMWSGTNEEGQYKYDQLPPGRYLIAASVEGPFAPGVIYGRIYYPNSYKLETATPISVGENEVVDGRNIEIAWLKIRRVEGVIMWPDGTPVTNGSISLYKYKDSPDGPDDRYAETNANQQGQFILQVIEGAEYWIHAHGYSQDEKYERINALPVRLNDSNFDQPLKIVVPFKKR